MIRVIDEEMGYRTKIAGTAIKDDSKIINLPPNDFTAMDDTVSYNQQ